ncbi:MAG: sn-glycerol-3-phosphate ABC transporter ATP-binding protein UgpC [Nitratireductor sp.]|nr:sn-glycerol-3-phosphate ABC transporter ATP-binding protein UgpC [Nitratireductor sp.]MCC0022572.1 sn-glycerol-3-phosphate ABC transporter ATP-binding protein UgpC [Nitratireductor sp.]
MASISLSGVIKDYGVVRAIHGVDLEIADGEFVAFVGPSGCGKSTLLRMIAGLEEISAGTIRIGGKIVNSVPPRERDVAMVFQDYALYPHMTVSQNIGFGLKMRGVPPDEINSRTREAAQTLQIEPLLERRPSELSGGQRQRVAMGRAIVRRPQVFLFDEPLSNLDAKLRVEMRTQIKRLHALFGRTTVYVTHDQVEALTLADRAVILKDGRLIQQGSPIELYEQPQSRFVAEFIGSPQMNMLPGIVEGDGRSVNIAGRSELLLEPIDAPRGQQILVGIRPEGFHLTDKEAGMPAAVEVVEPLGSDTMAICKIGNVTITVRLSPEHRVRTGDTLPLAIDLRKVSVFDAQSGKRI